MLWANYHSGTPQKDETEEITMNNQNRNQNNNCLGDLDCAWWKG